MMPIEFNNKLRVKIFQRIRSDSYHGFDTEINYWLNTMENSGCVIVDATFKDVPNGMLYIVTYREQ